MIRAVLGRCNAASMTLLGEEMSTYRQLKQEIAQLAKRAAIALPCLADGWRGEVGDARPVQANPCPPAAVLGEPHRPIAGVFNRRGIGT